MKLLYRFLLLTLLATACTRVNVCCAAEPQSAEQTASARDEVPELTYKPQWPEPPNTGAMLMRLGIGTVVVLALCVGSLWFGKPWLQKLQVGSTPSRQLQVEGSVSLGSRAVLYLVKVGDTQLVAGTDAGGLKSLVIVPASFREVLDEQLPAVEPTEVATRYFDTRLPAVAGSKE